MWFPDHADAWGQMSVAEAMGDAGPQSEVHSTIRSAVHSSSVLLYESITLITIYYTNLAQRC